MHKQLQEPTAHQRIPKLTTELERLLDHSKKQSRQIQMDKEYACQISASVCVCEC